MPVNIVFHFLAQHGCIGVVVGITVESIESCVMLSFPEYTLPSFKLRFSRSFITFCYVIFSLSMAQAMDIFMIT